MESENSNGFIVFIGAVVISVGLFYLGGWSIAWNDFIATKKSLYIGHGLAIEFNNRYYGLLFKHRFFDSPVISWIMGLIAFSTLSAGIKSLVDEDEDEDEDEKQS